MQRAPDLPSWFLEKSEVGSGCGNHFLDCYPPDLIVSACARQIGFVCLQVELVEDDSDEQIHQEHRAYEYEDVIVNENPRLAVVYRSCFI